MTYDNISIALLQEIWLKENEPFSFKGYQLVSKCRPEGYGGVGILIRQELAYKRLDLPDFDALEVVGIRITKGFNSIHLISAYLSPVRRFANEDRSFLEKLFLFLEEL